MDRLTLEEYISCYEDSGYRRLYDDRIDRSNRLTDKQIRQHYNRYIERLDRQGIRSVVDEDIRWNELKKSLPRCCQLMSRLAEEGLGVYRQIIVEESHGLYKTIDMAHVFPRGGYPHMKYLSENVVSLNRFSHNNLDSLRDPITGDPITESIREQWWRFIIGSETYDMLLKISRERVPLE